MNPAETGHRYALVVPESARAAAERVTREVRTMLKIEVYVVGEGGTIELV
jgi:hypothetical protein